MSIASQFGKGAVRESKSVRDTHLRMMASLPLIDWSVPYKVPTTMPVLNQGTSSACTAHATAEYCMALEQIENGKLEEYSRRYIYSQSSLGLDQGAYIWKAMSVPLKGLASEISVPDAPMSEEIELDGSLNSKADIMARSDKYAVIPRSTIDQMAQIIKDYGGFITGFNGYDGMFAPDGTVIDWSKSDFGHCVYVYGYELRGGKKYLRFRNSWSNEWGSGGDGFFPEAFVNSGMLFDLYVFANILDLDSNFMMLTAKQVRELQALEGFHDDAGIVYWTGKTLAQYLAARVPDKLKELNDAFNLQA